jgi:hypothetical protein
MFGFRKKPRRRKPQDPMKQLGNAAGKAIGALIVGAVINFLRKK